MNWYGNVIILKKLSPLAELEIVILITFGAAFEENFVSMKILFQCMV